MPKKSPARGRANLEQRNGDPYDSTSQGRQPYVKPDRQP
jgi:hypothetical protein